MRVVKFAEQPAAAAAALAAGKCAWRRDDCPQFAGLALHDVVRVQAACAAQATQRRSLLTLRRAYFFSSQGGLRCSPLLLSVSVMWMGPSRNRRPPCSFMEARVCLILSWRGAHSKKVSARRSAGPPVFINYH